MWPSLKRCEVYVSPRFTLTSLLKLDGQRVVTGAWINCYRNEGLLLGSCSIGMAKALSNIWVQK